VNILRLFLSRVGQLLVVLLAVTLVVFVLTQVAPGDPARLRLGPRASQDAVDELRHQLGLDQSLPAQYVNYLLRVVRGDFGVSVDGQQVRSIVAQRFADTAWLVSGTVVASVLSAIALAWLAAMYRDRIVDHTLRLVMLLVLFLPSFWVGFLLIRFVAMPTGWFPVAGLGNTAAELVRALILPSITGAISLAPVLVRSLRSSLVDVLDSEYVAVAKSLGISGPVLAFRHVMRNALGPVITLLALNVGYLMFGVVVLEATFDIPGLGSALVLASAKQDVYVVQGITLIFAVGVVVATFLGESAVALLDPKVARS
jgi:peptide/nickel transport system permease protein